MENETPRPPDAIDYATSNEAGVVTGALQTAAKGEAARYSSTINRYLIELYEQGGNDAIARWAPFLDDAARSSNQYLAALQKGGSELSGALGQLNKIPGAKALSKVGAGPLDVVLGGASVVNDYRNGDNWVSELGKQATSITLSGLAGGAATAAVATALGVATTAAAPIIIGGAVAVGVGYGISTAWDYVEENWDDITEWTSDKLDAAGTAISEAASEFGDAVDAGLNKLGEWADDGIEAFDKWAEETKQRLTDLAKEARDGVAQFGEDVATFLEEARDAAEAKLAEARDALLDGMQKVKDAAEEFWNDGKQWANDAFDYAVENLQDFGSAAQEWLGDRWNDLRDLSDRYVEGVRDLWEDGRDVAEYLGGKTVDFVNYLRGFFDEAAVTRSPIILDLDGNGVTTRTIALGTYFDLDGNRFAEATGWADANDGILVVDRNGDGQIDSGSELFGNFTELGSGGTAAHGFEALVDMDANRDGVVDDQDALFSDLRIWQDANSDGVAQEGEVVALGLAGVASLSTDFVTSTDVDDGGNEHRQQGSYTTTGGETRDMTDVWFKTDSADTRFMDEIEVPLDILEELPDISGAGNVMSLHQAMAHDPDGPLETAVRAYMASESEVEREGLLLDIVYHWAGVFDVDPLSRAATQIYGNVIGDARKLETLEAIIGEGYVGIWCWGELDRNPHGPAAAILLDAFNGFVSYVRGQLDAQTIYEDWYDLLSFAWDDASSRLVIDVTALVAEFELLYEADQAAFQVEFVRFVTGISHGGAYGEDLLAMLRAAGDAEGAGLDLVLASAGAPNFTGTPGRDALRGDNDANVLIGLEGDDTLTGGSGDDTLIGGTGNDVLTGSAGADVYQFNLGDGADTINNFDNQIDPAQPDVLVLGAGIVPSQVSISRNYFDLVLTIEGTTDSITISSFLDRAGESSFAIDEVRFADGTIWTRADIMDTLNTPTEGDDYIFGGSGADDVDALGGIDNIRLGGGNDTGVGGAGDDFLYGDEGADDLSGGADNDKIYGGEGDDTLQGGSGDDLLDGGDGANTYVFNPGWGDDTVESYNRSGDAAVDILSFGPGTTPANLMVRRVGSDLVLSHSNDTDEVRVRNHFARDNYGISEVQFSDGTSWDRAALQLLSQAGTEGDDTLHGADGNDTLTGLGGEDSIYGGEGADSISGGADDDRLFGGDGDDTLNGDAGDDRLEGGNGTDTYLFDAGWGSDTVNNYDWTNDGTATPDVVSFGIGVDPADLTVSRVSNDLLLTHANGTDVVRITNHFSGDRYQVAEVRFADGTTWSPAQLRLMTQQGTGGADTLYGSDLADTLSGLGGRDVIYGEDGADSLLGGAEYDRLFGGNGDDTLNGGAGDDRLEGDNGTDLYVFDAGWGDDTINNYDWTNDGTATPDVVSFGIGVDPADLTVSRVSNDLVLTHSNGTDSLRIGSHFSGERYEVAEVRFADGTIWTPAQIQVMTQQGTAGNDTLYGTGIDETLQGLGGNDYIYGEGGADDLSGGADNDRLYGGDGADTLTGGVGDDRLEGGNGTDVYMLGAGWGRDTISNYDYSGDGAATPDVVIFGAGVDAGDIQVSRVLSDLMLEHANGVDALRISRHFSGDRYAVSEVRFASGTVWTAAMLQAMAQQGTAGDDSLFGTDVADTLTGLAGDDYLYGEGAEDSLSGGADNDRIYGGDADDTLDGGSGNDRLEGEAGTDTYVFEAGWGNDTVANYDYSGGGDATPDVIVFGVGVAPADLAVSRLRSDLVIEHSNGTDSLRVINHFSGPSYEVFQIRFADGTIWSLAEIERMTQQGTSGNDSLYGTDGADTLDGLTGDDYLYGEDGADDLSGGADQDRLYGGAGDDTLEGGAGNDRLDGGNDTDTYVFQAGWGNDTIENYDRSSGDDPTPDVVIFGAGVNPADLSASRTGNNLVLTHANGTDSLRISSHFSGERYQVNEVRFDDGTVWDLAQLLLMTQQGTAGNDSLIGTEGADTLDGLAGADYIDGQAGADDLSGGDDNDRLYGRDGNDTLDGGDGNDRLEGGDGADSYVFAQGWGQDTVSDYDNSDDPAATPDTLTFGAGVLAGDITAKRISNDLYLIHANGTDEVRITSHFAGTRYEIAEVRFDDGTVWTPAQIALMTQQGTAGNDTLYGTEGADTLDGLDGNDYIYGDVGADRLVGGDGNDRLYGEEDNDTLHGGAGNDRLDGGSGTDAYLFAAGWGDDTIYNYDRSGDGAVTPDVAIFAAGIDPGDIAASRSGSNLILTHSNGTDRIIVSNHFSNENYQVSQVRFSDGTTWDPAQLLLMTQQGTAGNDSLFGTDGDDTLDALGGADSVYGEDGADDLSGGADNDRVFGGDGNDTLNGGSGNDRLEGQNGIDTYVFDAGWGNDTIGNYDWSSDGAATPDVVIFGAGVAAGDIAVSRIGSNLYLAHSNGTDILRIDNHFSDERYEMAEIRFADGTIWTPAQLQSMTQQGTSGNDTLYGTEGADTLDGLDGNDYLYGEEGADRLVGGPGNERLYGADGDDTLYSGTGDDRIEGGNGTDAYLFVAGWGSDTISNYDYSGDGTPTPDAVIFGYGVDAADITVSRVSSDMILRHSNGTDALRVTSHFSGERYQVDSVRFGDGTVWTAAELFAMSQQGTAGDDSLYGTDAADDTLRGLDGNDYLYGEDGNDLLYGDGDDDRLYGDNGMDTLHAGTGDDRLEGGYDTDTYVFEAGWGSDTIYNYDWSSDGSETPDRILFGAGVRAADITASRQFSDLYLTHANGTDVVRLVSHFSGERYRIEEVRFDDGTVWLLDEDAELTDRRVEGGAPNDLLYGSSEADLINGFAGFDWIVPGRGNDTVDGGADRDMVSYSDQPEVAGRRVVDFMLDLDLGAGTAEIFGGELDELISIERATGTIFADVMRGSAGDDELRGLGDYDWFIATGGQDTIDGGNGQDMITFVEAQSSGAPPVQDVFANDGAPPAGAAVAGVTLDLTDPSRSTGLAQGLTLISVERVTGSSYQDVFYGDANQNDFRGLGGYDWFVGSTGGRERYYGGDGIDTVTYFQSSTGVIASLRNGAGEFNGQETGYGSGGDAVRDLYFEIENLVGTQHRDRLEGNSERNQLAGLGDDDFLYGYGGIDYIEGGDGNDYIDGGAASDYALYDGTLSEYTITRTSATDVTITGRGYTDTLTNVEYFQFDDATANIWEQTIV